MYTKQETFDIIATHLRNMPHRCVQYDDNEPDPANFKCLYRGDDNLACAVGILIPDEIYTVQLEEIGSVEIILDGRTPGADWLEPIVAELKKHDVELMADLQDVHDASYNWDAFGFDGEDALRYCALKHGIRYTAPTKEK